MANLAAIPTSAVINSQLVPVYGARYIYPDATVMPVIGNGAPASITASSPAPMGAATTGSVASSAASFLGSTPFWVVVLGIIAYILFWRIHYS